jgi:uncharacterized protein
MNSAPHSYYLHQSGKYSTIYLTWVEKTGVKVEPARYIIPHIINDLGDKMVFLGGPRQVGKTTTAQLVAEAFTRSEYRNWDSATDRKAIQTDTLSDEAGLLILDEIHKYPKWKSYVKGLYDKGSKDRKILVTGSARLNVYRRGGDSMVGRYHYLRLHPFSVAELCGGSIPQETPCPLQFLSNVTEAREYFDILLRYGGFPEPCLKQNSRNLRRWQNERVERVVKEDIRDGEGIRDLSKILLLAEDLSRRVSSLLSLNSLRSDFEVAHKTISHWVEVLEHFYFCYRIPPFAHSSIKSLKKEQKLYLWDWSTVEDAGSRLENLVASHLLKFCNAITDCEGYRVDLYYLRDNEQREVDFLVTVDKKPWLMVEVKSGDTSISQALRYFKSRIDAPYVFQLTTNKDVDFVKDGIRVMEVAKFLRGLV